MSKVLNGEIRQHLNKGANGRLRKTGKIPAVVYGHAAPFAISVNEREFHNSFKRISESEIINLTIGTADHRVLIKDYQRDYLKGTIRHIDFYEIEKGAKLRTHTPIRVVGVAPGLREGGILENPIHELEIECVAEMLPEFIELDISTLVLGHAIHVRDLKLDPSIKVLNNPDQVLASITHARIEVVAPVVADEAAPAAAAAPAAKKE